MSPERQSERVDPRILRTRQALEQAFTDLLGEKGFQDITVQDITQRAGLNRATFYAHFADKYALLDHRIRQGFLAEINQRMLHACRYSTDNLRSLIIAVCVFTRRSVAHCKPPLAQYESLVESQVKAVLYEVLLNWMKQVKATTSPETAATAGSWAIYGLVSQWNHAQKARSAVKFAEQVLPIVAANLQIAKREA